MKIKFIIGQVIFLVLLSSTAFSQSNWIWQNPSITGNDLYNVQFTDENTGYALGYEFMLLKTTNSGENWEVKNIDLNPVIAESFGKLKEMYFINSMTGYVGRKGVLKTTDGGDNWSYHNTNASVNSIVFMNSDTGFAACDSGKIIKTIDGGNNWFVLLAFGNENINFYKIDFISLNTGFVVGDFQTILKTTDNGNSWIMKSGNQSSSLSDFTFVNSTTGYVAGSYGLIAKTTNMGENWAYLQNTGVSGNISDVKFSSQDTGLLVSNSSPITEGKIYLTTNGGVNWTLLRNFGINIFKVAFMNNNTAVLTCESGRIYKTTNSGFSWLEKNIDYTLSNLAAINFVSDNFGYVVSSNGVILKTTNGGNEWRKMNAPANEKFSYIKFFDEYNGYLAGDTLYRTSNSGLSWNKLINLSAQNNIQFLNLDTGYYINGRYLHKTFNGGQNWISQNTEDYIQCIYFFQDNNDIGFKLDSYWQYPSYQYFNGLYKTTDNGLNWVQTQTFGNGVYGGYYNSITFVNSQTGFVSGKPGIRKTTNSGVNWNTIPGLTGLTGKLYFYNENVGFVSGNNKMYKTTDSGNNWIEVFHTSKNLNSYYFTDINTGYIIGEYGYILKTTDGGGTVNVFEENRNIPSSFNLYQNYPNPFNPNTNITFKIPYGSFVKLIVYDLLGREIKSLIKEKLPAGRHEASFDANDLSSGIYFYKLETENFSQTKRMVLIK